MICIRAGRDLLDEPERYRGTGAGLLEIPLRLFPGVNPGKLRLQADRTGLRTLAALDGLEDRAGTVIERALPARFDYVEIPLGTDVESRGRALARARKAGQRTVVSQRSRLPPGSVESTVRALQKCSRAGGDLVLGAFPAASVEDVRVLLGASRALRAMGVPFGLAGTGPLSPLVSLLPGGLTFCSSGGRGDGLDVSVASRIGPGTGRFAHIEGAGARARGAAVLDGCFRALGLDAVCVGLSGPMDGAGALFGLLVEMGFLGVSLERAVPGSELPVLPPEGRRMPSVSVVTVRPGGIFGHDTDGPALLRALAESGIRVRRRRAVVAGTGAAALSAASALRRNGARVALAGRSLRGALRAARSIGAAAAAAPSVASLLRRSSLLVKADPELPQDFPAPSSLHAGLVVADLDGTGTNTPILRAAGEAGAQTVDGTAVAIHRVAETVSLLTGLRPSRATVDRLISEKARRGGARD
ncbi:MAG: hypothetical protein FJ149_09345 [Euryarchaeota archaeon]|nr:hypothetical protein [Euryarchaeota archaeon]